MQLRRELELLAPARTIDIGIAAIDCGADAVYIAGPSFGARKAAGNSVEDIAVLCDYAHGFGARIFVTLNTIIYDDELSAAYDLLESVTQAGADAVIVQDLALTEVARGSAMQRRLPLHASTQCAVRTPEAARFYEGLGFSRLVLERELSLTQIQEIRKVVSCELEFFVHGALCVCYSGQCYLSEMIAGRSANRGECIQACRSRYDLVDGNGKKILSNKSLLSLRDFNLKHRLEALADAGVTSFKIEGRLKNKSYVKNIVRDYSLAIDELVARRPEDFRRASFGRVSGGFKPQADRTFNRGYTSLYIDGERGDWACPDAAKSMGEEIGTVVGISPDGCTVDVRNSDIVLNNGDGFSFVDRDGQVRGFRADIYAEVSSRHSGGPQGKRDRKTFDIRVKGVEGLRSGVTLYRNLNIAFEKKLEAETPVRLLDVKAVVSGHLVESDLVLTVSAVSEDGRRAELRRVFPLSEVAENQARMRDIFTAQISKVTGIFKFSAEPESSAVLPHMPVGAVNALRRELADVLSSSACHSLPLYLAPVPSVLSDNPSESPLGLPRVENTSYKDNIANKVSANLYRRLGAAEIVPAYELVHQKGAELMRTKYCIRYQLGMCPYRQTGSLQADREPQAVSKPQATGQLRLLNQGRVLYLDFDCASCEMIVRFHSE